MSKSSTREAKHDNMRATLFSLLFLSLFPACAWAHVEMLDIHVISFKPSKQPDSYVLVFDAATTDDGAPINPSGKKQRFEVHLRQDPRFSVAETYREGVRILRDRLSRGPDITIGRMSGRGWQPIAGRKGVFQSVGLNVYRSPEDASDEHAVVYFIHDDRF